MKSRTSFFDATALKKDITRFLPVWMIYTIGALLVAFSVAMHYERYTSGYSMATDLNQIIGQFGMINICYGGLTAVLLFGDLFNTRLCNALHAMPLRREGWFFTHITAGFLFSAAPNLLVSLLIMPFLEECWYTALLWYLGMEMHYVFFFLLAVLCCMCAGKWFAAISMYAIVNFLSMILMWFTSTVFAPLVYGVQVSTEGFSLFSPVVHLIDEKDFVRFKGIIEHGSFVSDGFYSDHRHTYVFDGFGESWGYLGILVAIGLAFGVLALVLYRKRHLETAGDFVAFRPLQPVFAVIFTLCAGALLQMVGNLVFSEGNYLFGGIGIIVGFFVAQMLLMRTVRVFRGKNWLFLGAIVAVLALSLVLCKADIFGIVRWTPDADDVVDVKVAEGTYEEWSDGVQVGTYAEPEQIQYLIDIHKLLIDEGPVEQRNNRNGSRRYTISYTLKDGREVRRYYRADYEGEGHKRLVNLLHKDLEYMLGAASVEEIKEKLYALRVDFGDPIRGEQLDMLLEYLVSDVLDGSLSGNLKPYKDSVWGTLELSYRDGMERRVTVYASSTKTGPWYQMYKKAMEAPDILRKEVYKVRLNGVELGNQQIEAFLAYFVWDFQYGKGVHLTEVDDYVFSVDLTFNGGLHITAYVQKEAKGTIGWYERFIKQLDKTQNENQ